MATTQEQYNKIISLGYNPKNILNLPVILTSSKWQNGEPTYANIGVFDVVADSIVSTIKQETFTTNTLDIVPLLASLQLNTGRENTHIGAYLYDNTRAFMEILSLSMLDTGAVPFYSSNRNYVKYVEMVNETTGAKYISKSNNNLNNPLSDTTKWELDTSCFDYTNWQVSSSNNNFVLSHVGERLFLPEYLHDGVIISFKATHTNTGAVNVIFDGYSTQYRIYHYDGSDLLNGNIRNGDIVTLKYNHGAGAFYIQLPTYDRNNYIVSGDANNITLASHGGVQYNASMLYNGFAISFVPRYTNTARTVSLSIDGVNYNVLRSDGESPYEDDIQANRLITLYYLSTLNAFVYDVSSLSAENIRPFGDAFVGGSVLQEGCVFMNEDHTIATNTHIEFCEKVGNAFSDANITSFCFIGAGSVWIDTQDTMHTGNDVFAVKPPQSIGILNSAKPYVLNNTYRRDDFTSNVYTYSGNKKAYIHSSNDPVIGNAIYDNPVATPGETIISKILDTITISNNVYTYDNTNNRKFIYGSYVAWLLDGIISIGSNAYITPNNEDPLDDVIGQVGAPTGVANEILFNNCPYALSSSQSPTNTIRWDNAGTVTTTEPASIYTLSQTPNENDSVFSEQFNKVEITDYTTRGFTIDLNGSGTISSFYQDSVDDTLYTNENSIVRYCNNVTEGAICYKTPIPIQIATVTSIANAFYSNALSQYLYRRNNTSLTGLTDANIYYIRPSATIAINARIYSSVYPTRTGTYSAFTSSSITVNGIVYTKSTSDNYNYISTSGVRYYAKKSLRPPVLYPTKNDISNGIALSASNYINKTQIRLPNGTTVTRLQSADDANITIRKIDGYHTLIFSGDFTKFLSTFDGEAPANTGRIGATVQSNGASGPSGVFYNSSGRHSRWGETGTANHPYDVSMDTSRGSNVYKADATQIKTAGIDVYCHQLRIL